MKKIIQILLILFFSSITINPQVQQHWVRSFTGGSYGLFINTDISGNAYVVGYMTGMDAPVITFLQAFNTYGTELWDTVLFNTPCNPIGVNLDSQYNQYIAGYYPGGWGPANFSIYKYNPAGIQLWSLIEPISFYYDRMYSMTGDNAGNSYIVRIKDSVLTLRKYNSSGVLQFAVNITDTLEPQSIAVDPSGCIIVSGFVNSGSIYSCAAIKYSSSGVKIWKRIFVPGGNGVLSYPGIKMLTAKDGSIYLLFTTKDIENYNQYTLLKYTPDGIQQWVSYYNNKNNSSNSAAMCLEINGDNTQSIVATGTSATVKYNSNGEIAWIDTSSSFKDIKIDSFGNYYLTGNTYSNPWDFRTIKLSNNGVKLWDITYNGSYNYQDGAYALALDNTGNIFVTGYCNSIPFPWYNQATTIKYSQTEIDSVSLNYLPLALGNIWVYNHYTNTPPSSNFEYRGKERYEIAKDTLMTNGKHYYDRTYLGYTRIEPVNFSVFSYFLGIETKRDSLKAKINDTVITCYHIADTAYKDILGSSRRNKFVNTFCMITNQQYFWNLTYRLGYWTYSNITDGTIEGFTDTLVGAVINGIVYGDTTINGLQKLSNYVPGEFSLSQNYPNPFNPATKIKFSIPLSRGVSEGRGMLVRLIVYDILGREVASLVNERLSPGSYEVEWDGSDYPSGVYFYKLITSGYTETRKMVLLK